MDEAPAYFSETFVEYEGKRVYGALGMRTRLGLLDSGDGPRPGRLPRGRRAGTDGSA